MCTEIAAPRYLSFKNCSFNIGNAAKHRVRVLDPATTVAQARQIDAERNYATTSNAKPITRTSDPRSRRISFKRVRAVASDPTSGSALTDIGLPWRWQQMVLERILSDLQLHGAPPSHKDVRKSLRLPAGVV